jgi:hypothetical protein
MFSPASGLWLVDGSSTEIGWWRAKKSVVPRKGQSRRHGLLPLANAVRDIYVANCGPSNGLVSKSKDFHM